MTRELRTLEDLRIWQQGLELARTVHLVTDHIVDPEGDDIVGRLRTTTVSLSAHIADGLAVRSGKGQQGHLLRALDSIGEVEETLVLSAERGYLRGTALSEIRSNISELNLMITEAIST